MIPIEEKLIRSLLKEEYSDLDILLYDSISSTNDMAKEIAKSGVNNRTLLIANQQLSGRGTKGRSFFSPEGGVYFTLLDQYSPKTDTLTVITPIAAVSAADAIEEISGKNADIKWVNDILISGKKVCGILCESLHSGKHCHTITGVGANVYPTENSFPEELRQTAACICDMNAPEGQRERFIALFLNSYLGYTGTNEHKSVHDKYEEKLFLAGKEAQVIQSDQSQIVQIIGIDDEFKLVIQYEDGVTEKLLSDEVTIQNRTNNILIIKEGQTYGRD